MDQVFAAFGVDWRLLIINLINFGILLTALWYFLYGPLTKMLASRRDTLAQGVADAEDAAARLRDIEASRASMIADAGKEADKLVADARQSASSKQKELIAAGEAAAASVVKSAEAQAQELKQQAIAESKQEVAKLIVLGMEKLAKQK
jgi:F-type H+-transporting ATPase subunit b